MLRLEGGMAVHGRYPYLGHGAWERGKGPRLESALWRLVLHSLYHALYILIMADEKPRTAIRASSTITLCSPLRRSSLTRQFHSLGPHDGAARRTAAVTLGLTRLSLRVQRAELLGPPRTGSHYVAPNASVAWWAKLFTPPLVSAWEGRFLLVRYRGDGGSMRVVVLGYPSLGSEDVCAVLSPRSPTFFPPVPRSTQMTGLAV